MTGPLAPFFTPRSVAVIGASRDPAKVGGSVVANLKAGGFAGRTLTRPPGRRQAAQKRPGSTSRTRPWRSSRVRCWAMLRRSTGSAKGMGSSGR